MDGKKPVGSKKFKKVKPRKVGVRHGSVVDIGGCLVTVKFPECPKGRTKGQRAVLQIEGEAE